MLSELRIENLALIDKLDLSFDGGLTILTGETGAGKTIIIEALNLLLGGRADSTRVRGGAAEAVVQGLFAVKPEIAGNLPDDIEAGDELLISRRVNIEGKSRAYVNGNLVTAAQLARIGDGLVDIHGQHEHQSLFRVACHLDFLDEYAGELVLSMRRDFGRLMSERHDLEKRVVAASLADTQKEARRDLLIYQIAEINAAAIDPQVDADAGANLSKLRHHGRLIAAAAAAAAALNADESGSYDRLQRARGELEAALEIDPGLAESSLVLSAISAQMEDVILELRRYQEAEFFDPARLNFLEDRVFLLDTLQKKYGGSLEAVIEYSRLAEEELENLDSGEAGLAKLSDRIASVTDELRKIGRGISKERQKAAALLSRAVNEQLAEVEMAKANFAVNLSVLDEESWQSSGADAVEFFMAPNKGEKLLPLSKIASGGEISRVMLALKTVLSRADSIPLMVFDEIDVGIGGKTAVRVGAKLAGLAKDRQVICVTHLPQIAAFADRQYRVAKEENEGRTVTKVEQLSAEERVSELTRMSGSGHESEAAAAHARELIEAARIQKAEISA